MLTTTSEKKSRITDYDTEDYTRMDSKTLKEKLIKIITSCKKPK